MIVPFIRLDPLHRPIKERVFARFGEIYDSGYFINGRCVREFEAALAEYCGRRHAIACNSGLSALHLACLGLGLGPGDEVICPANTFAATALAPRYTGATVRFADIDPPTMNVDVASVRSLVNRRTRAIMAVHMYGNPCDVGSLVETGIPVVEDAAHAHGAAIGGRRAGSFGAVSCFSFFQTKNLGGMSDGGMVLTDDPELAERLRILRDVGQSGKHNHVVVGYNYRMSEFNAAFLGEKLSLLEGWNGQRRASAGLYDQAFAGHPLIRLQQRTPDSTHAYHLYVIRLAGRDLLQRRLREDGITTEVQYPVPIHLQAPWQGSSAPLPAAEEAAGQILSLPVFAGISTEEVRYVADRVLAHVAT